MEFFIYRIIFYLLSGDTSIDWSFFLSFPVSLCRLFALPRTPETTLEAMLLDKTNRFNMMIRKDNNIGFLVGKRNISASHADMQSIAYLKQCLKYRHVDRMKKKMLVKNLIKMYNIESSIDGLESDSNLLLDGSRIEQHNSILLAFVFCWTYTISTKPSQSSFDLVISTKRMLPYSR